MNIRTDAITISPLLFKKKLGNNYLNMLGWVFEENLTLSVVGRKKSAVLPQQL